MSGGVARIRPASSAAECRSARALFVEYAAWLNVDLCFQDFSDELATLPGKYAPPEGRLLLAYGNHDALAGCVALRRLPYDPSGQSCELKRLWVRPAFRGLRIGRGLTQSALDAAREIGYRSIKLDTMPDIMPNSVAMYRAFGFVECAPYYHNPIWGSIYMELAL